jgi:hypothetical protein
MEKLSEIFILHGINHVFSSNHSKIVRVFWILAVLISFCGFFFYLKNSWRKLIHEPEVVIKTSDLFAKNFPFPSITICPFVFANHKILNINDVMNVMRKFSDDECKVIFANVLWWNPYLLGEVLKYCSKGKIMNVNVAETIVQSSVTSEELFGLELQRTGFSGFGACYTLNGLSFGELFKAENIHDDFKQFQKFLSNGSEDISAWSHEKGLKINTGSAFRPLFINSSHSSLEILFKLSPSNFHNVVSGANFKMFIHKPNEIVTKMSEDFNLNYNEVRHEL